MSGSRFSSYVLMYLFHVLMYIRMCVVLTRCATAFNKVSLHSFAYVCASVNFSSDSIVP